MLEYIKKRIIKSLIEEIICLDSTSLELVGHNIVSIIECKRMIHHGINKNYMPSGHTVDSFTDDSTIVTEYSTEQDYFSPAYNKISNDINHALDHCKPIGLKKIYLISSQEEPPSFRKKFNATPLFQSHGDKIIIYDAREIGKLIYEQSIENPIYAAFYRQYFARFSQDLDNYEYYGKIPSQCEKYVSEASVQNAIQRHFAKGQNICILHGVSGSGKTQATIDYIHHNETNFENYIWITGDDWPQDTPLQAVQRTRGGSPINVSGIFNSSKTLLAIDNINRSLDKSKLSELMEGFGKGGVVLATSQISIPGSPLYLAIPTLSKEVASLILNENPETISDKCNEVINACRFSPLILSTIRNMVELEGVKRNELYDAILAAPAEIAGADGLSIMRSILNKLTDETLNALKKIANSGSSTHDYNFLKEFVGLLPRSNLQRLSILTSTSTPGIVKVHDLICKSVQDNPNGFEIAKAINEYIEKNKGEMTPSVLRQIHLCNRQINKENALSEELNLNWLVYATLQIEGVDKNYIHELIYDKEITPDLSLSSVMCIIEAKEIHSYRIDDYSERKAYYKQCAEKYQMAFNESNQDDVKAELLHHQGKALRRCSQYEEACACFLQLLEFKPDWHAAYGQIAFLGTIHGIDRCIKKAGRESIQTLLNNMLSDALSVPLRVSLAALARLRSYAEVYKAISSQEDIKKLADIIAMSSLEGFGQFYEAFVSFTSMFGYNHSLCCVNLVETLPEILAMPPELVDKDQWISACEGLANTAVAARKIGKLDLFNRTMNASMALVQKVLSEKQLGSFDARAIAKALILADRPKEALDVIAKVPHDKIDHWLLYRKAEAQLAFGDGDALKNAKKALELAEGDSNIGDRISSYYDLVSKCYEKSGDHINALSELKNAIEKCLDPQYKKSLLERLTILKKLA